MFSRSPTFFQRYNPWPTVPSQRQNSQLSLRHVQSLKAEIVRDSNPFTTTQNPTGAAAIEVVRQKNSGRVFEIVHNAFRGLLAFLCFGVLPILLVPPLKNMFEEFGIELPLISQLVVQLSYRARAFFYLFLPFALVVFAGIEIGIYSIRSRFLEDTN